MMNFKGFNGSAGGGRRLGGGDHVKAPGGGRFSAGGSLFGTLVKKQFMELSTMFSMGKRRSMRGSTGGFAITLALYILVAFSIGTSMMLLAEMLSDELLGKGEDWKFFVILDILGVAIATLVTMFSVDVALFRAKDNEILLSMPIPPGYILLARMVPLYVIALILTSAVLIPELAVYKMNVGAGIPLIILNILLILALAFLALGLSTVLGWLLSLVNSRFKGNGIVSLIITVAFLGAYFFIYFQINKFSQAMVGNSSAMADFVRRWLKPIYFIGQAHTGSVIGLVIGLITIVVVFGVIYFAMSRTFRGIVVNAGKGSSHKVGSGILKTGSSSHALFLKEIKRFTSSSSYMMNCGLGPVFMLILSVAAVIKRDVILSGLEQVNELFEFNPSFVAGILALMIFALVSTCYYTMPSISLEGKSIWILQSMPLDPMKIFMSKIKMEYVLCVPGILVLTTVGCIILGLSPISWLAVIVAALAYTTFTAFFGLWINLLRPSLDWTNEAYPIKQGLNPLICLFGEWLLTLIFGGIYFFVGIFVPAEAYLLLVSVVLLVVSYIIYRWLLKGGRARFAAL